MKSTFACIIRGKVFLKIRNRVQFVAGFWTNVQARCAKCLCHTDIFSWGESVTAVNALGRGGLWSHSSPLQPKGMTCRASDASFLLQRVLCHCRSATPRRAPPEGVSALTFYLLWVWGETQFSFQRIWPFCWSHFFLFLSLRLSFPSLSKSMQTCQPHHPSLLRIAILWAPEITYDRPIQTHSFEVSCLLLLLASFSCSRKDSRHISMENVI